VRLGVLGSLISILHPEDPLGFLTVHRQTERIWAGLIPGLVCWVQVDRSVILCCLRTLRGLRGFREARRDFWRGAESLEAALTHNAEVPRRRAQEAEEAGAALRTARAGYRGRALDYALQVPDLLCPPEVPGPQVSP
jgi:hypothetical protein